MDIALGDTLHFKFTTLNSSGVPTTPSGLTVDIYENDSTAQLAPGVLLTVTTAFDGVAGLNHVSVDCQALAGFESGKSYSAVVSGGTVGGNSIVGTVIANWTIDSAAQRGLTNTQELSLADEILKRSVSNVENTASNHSLAELILGAFEFSISSGTWTIKKTDGATTFNTRTLTTTSGADPITGAT